MQHLFVDYSFIIDCWKELYPTDTPWISQLSIGKVIQYWKNKCPWKNKKNNLAQRVWNILPYTMLWSIWMARNRKIFKDKMSTSRSACTKAKTLSLETISVKAHSNIDATEYSVEERNFISYIFDKNHSI